MTSAVTNHSQWQAPLCRGGFRSGGGRSSSPAALLRLPRVAPIKVTFSSSLVCNGTSSLSASTEQNRSPDPSPVTPPCPMLLVPSKSDDNYPYCFVSLSDNKIIELKPRRYPWDDEYLFPDDTEFCSSSPVGWILMMHPRTRKMHLINPLFPAYAVIPLPAFQPLDPSFVAGSVYKPSDWSRQLLTQYVTAVESSYPNDYGRVARHVASENLTFYPKFAMSSVPTDRSFTVVMQHLDRLGFWKPGHTGWTIAVAPEGSYSQVVYSSTGKCFYALRGDNVDAWKWNRGSPKPRRTIHFRAPWPYPKGYKECDRYNHCWNSSEWHKTRRYLVESSDGELLLVEVFANKHAKENYEFDPTSIQFFVFKLNLEKGLWETINSLGGGCSLFMGNYYCLCVPVGNYPELKPNCIYLDHKRIVFDMEDATIYPKDFIPKDLIRNQHGAIWVLPNHDSCI